MKTFNLFYGVILLGLFAGSSPLLAQSEESVNRYLALRESSRRTLDNSGHWSVTLSGGGSAYFGEYDMTFTKNFGDWVAPIGKIAVSRWFSSAWGVRFQADGGIFKNYRVEMEESSTQGEFYYADGYLQVITNVMNWGHIKRTQRPVSILLVGGLGMAWTPSREFVPAQFTPAALLGGQLNIRMTDFWSLALEIDGTIVKDNFNSHTGGRKYEGWATATIGLAYRFF